MHQKLVLKMYQLGFCFKNAEKLILNKLEGREEAILQRQLLGEKN